MAEQTEALRQIAASLNVMLGSAVALVDGMGNVVGYQIKTGALHRILGHMASVNHPVTVPLCRTQIVLNHESSPWPLEGKAGVEAPAAIQHCQDCGYDNTTGHPRNNCPNSGGHELLEGPRPTGVSPTSHPTFCRDTPAKEG
jgi:hypothetical protein